MFYPVALLIVITFFTGQVRLLDVSSFNPACFVEAGTRLLPDFALVYLNRFISRVSKLTQESEPSSLEEISSTVSDLKMRVAALDSTQALHRTVVDELSVRVNFTSARSLEDHDEIVNRRNEHKIVIHGLKSITTAGRVEMKAEALREVTRLFNSLFNRSSFTIVQVRYFSRFLTGVCI